MTDFQFMAGLRPELAELAIKHRQACEAEGIPLLFLSGLRSPEEQMAAYAKGREVKNGVWVVTNPHLVVTFALPDQSPHCLGAAYDCAPLLQPGHRVDWNRIDLFERVGRLVAQAEKDETQERVDGLTHPRRWKRDQGNDPDDDGQNDDRHHYRDEHFHCAS